VNSPFEARIGIPFWFRFTPFPSGWIYEVSVHHVYLERLLGSGKVTALVGASMVSWLVPAPKLSGLVDNSRSVVTGFPF